MKPILCFLLISSSLISQGNKSSALSDNQFLKSTKVDARKASIALDAYLDHLEKIEDPFYGQILIYNEEEEIYYRSHGYANEEFQVEANRKTSYNLASITKMLTALVVLKMQEENLVDINEPIETYIDDLSKTDIGRSTIYELLTHSSGLPEPNENYLWEFVHVEKHDYHIDSITNQLKNVSIKKEDRGETDYTNLGAILTSLALEKISGQSYESLLDKYLIEPLGLENTGLAIAEDIQEITRNKAKTYERYYGTFYEYPFAKVGLLGAAAGLHSSIEDLQKIVSAVFLRKSFLSASSLKTLTQPYKEGSEYSFGCFNMQFPMGGDESVNVVGHEGYIWGVSTAALYLPEYELGFILLSNRRYSANIEEDLRKLVPLFLGGEANFQKMRIDNRIMQINDDDSFLQYVNGLNDLNELKEDYGVSEYYINELGYHLIEKDNYKKAEAVFKMNCRLFPNSANTYDSLGEVQYLLKDYDNASINYKKSIELDPENENAAGYLQKIESLKKR